MEINEALDILECMANLTDGELLSYLCKHSRRIGKAARIGANAIKKQLALDDLLKCWGTFEKTEI